MVKHITIFITIVFLLSSCSSLRPLNFTSSRQAMTEPVSTTTAPVKAITKAQQVKFIDDIAVIPQQTTTQITTPASITAKEETKETYNFGGGNNEEPKPAPSIFGDRSAVVENASSLQLKYAVLLNTEVEQLQNQVLLQSIDEWYGTRYRLGGTTKKGIDCSAFVRAVFAAAYSLSLPRTAREQYRNVRHISRTELQEGDLLFFNTRGGVSHVGIYLQNNKFVHASVSKGVTVSDMFDSYYLQRFIGAGRIESQQDSVIAAN